LAICGFDFLDVRHRWCGTHPLHANGGRVIAVGKRGFDLMTVGKYGRDGANETIAGTCRIDRRDLPALNAPTDVSHERDGPSLAKRHADDLRGMSL
jgi:hypothetical protein